MNLDELISLCESKGKTLSEYKEIREIVEKEYDKLEPDEQYILGESLELLELTIDMLEDESEVPEL